MPMSLFSFMLLFWYLFVREYLSCLSSQKEHIFSPSPHVALVIIVYVYFQVLFVKTKLYGEKFHRPEKHVFKTVVIKKEKLYSSELNSVETRSRSYPMLGLKWRFASDVYSLVLIQLQTFFNIFIVRDDFLFLSKDTYWGGRSFKVRVLPLQINREVRLFSLWCAHFICSSRFPEKGHSWAVKLQDV